MAEKSQMTQTAIFANKCSFGWILVNFEKVLLFQYMVEMFRNVE
jgi:hypothetical protein